MAYRLKNQDTGPDFGNGKKELVEQSSKSKKEGEGTKTYKPLIPKYSEEGPVKGKSIPQA